jgi:hypothetical protein
MSGKPNSKKTSTTSTSDAQPPGVGHNSKDQAQKDAYVSAYRKHHKEEGKHFVEKCKVVVEAQDVLPVTVFNEFCKEVDLPRNSSMFRKARIVAQAADRLLALGNRLPDAKDTLYHLAAADEHVFTEMANSNERITTERVKAARPKDPKKPEKCKFFVDATTLRHGERLALLRAIKDEAEKIGATVTVSKSFRGGEARP